MFAHRGEHIKSLLALACALAVLAPIALAGCGGGDEAPGSTATAPMGSSAESADADPGDLEVIKGWSEALSDGDVREAAGYFATPSSTQNGPIGIEIESLRDAIVFNKSLPCAAEVIDAETADGRTTATFLLGERPGGDCGGGSGGEAATEFRIEDGKIVDWRRVDTPGSGGGSGGGPAPGSPA